MSLSHWYHVFSSHLARERTKVTEAQYIIKGVTGSLRQYNYGIFLSRVCT